MNRELRDRVAMLAALVMAVGPLAGCAAPYATPEAAIHNACSALGPKALSGALIGAAAGAAGGAAIGGAAGGGNAAGYGALAGLAVGLLVGAVAGNAADRGDCEEAQVALQQMNTAPIGQPIAWRNPASGSSGSYTPVTDISSANGQICRQIRADYDMKGHSPIADEPGVVCRTPDGNWDRVISKA